VSPLLASTVLLLSGVTLLICAVFVPAVALDVLMPVVEDVFMTVLVDCLPVVGVSCVRLRFTTVCEVAEKNRIYVHCIIDKVNAFLELTTTKK